MKIGIVTGGGDCPGLNAVIRAVAKTANKRSWETIGILGGYDGLLPPQHYRLLDYNALAGLLVRGGTILGTANRGHFSAKTGHGEVRQLPKELIDETKKGMEALGISALVAVGGDGSLTIAQQMHEAGIPIVGVPKTIDNDLRPPSPSVSIPPSPARPTRWTVCTRPLRATTASWCSN